MGMQLFDDGGAGADDDISKIEINHDFAKRYEHNKKREDLQRFEELKKKGLVHDSDSPSESESESDELDDDVDGRFFDALLKVRKKDPILSQKDAKLFDDDDDDEDINGGEREEKVKKSKPKYLKDVMAETLIAEGPEFEDDDGDVGERSGGGGERKVRSYVEEQEDLRKEVLSAMAEAERGIGEEDEEGGELLREKERGGGEVEEGGGGEIAARLDEFFGEDGELDENDMFLKGFFKNKMWIDRERGGNLDNDEDISDDEEAVERQEDYEREFNFRFEESKSDRVLGYSRVVEGSVRKEANARKQQRERKKEREEVAEVERREEVKRLKNLKRREVQEKIRKIREVAGVDGEEGIGLDEGDLEKDFDPEEFDRKMRKAFGEEYYEAEDADPGFANEGESDLEKPDFGKEDELLGLPKDWDVIKSNDGFLAERERMKSSKAEDGDDGEEGEGDEEEQVEGKRKRKRKSKLKEALEKELEEELYKLDYEDSIGDLKTRFKYRQVNPDRFKLSAAEILWLDEHELNQYVSLKKLAPYRDQEWKVPQMRKKLLLGGLLSGQKKLKKRKMDGEGPSGTKSEKGSEEAVITQGEEPSNEESKLSRSARRRRSQKDKKLPPSRLVAYGKIPSSSLKKSRS